MGVVRAPELAFRTRVRLTFASLSRSGRQAVLPVLFPLVAPYRSTSCPPSRAMPGNSFPITSHASAGRVEPGRPPESDSTWRARTPPWPRSSAGSGWSGAREEGGCLLTARRYRKVGHPGSPRPEPDPKSAHSRRMSGELNYPTDAASLVYRARSELVLFPIAAPTLMQSMPRKITGKGVKGLAGLGSIPRCRRPSIEGTGQAVP